MLRLTCGQLGVFSSASATTSILSRTLTSSQLSTATIEYLPMTPGIKMFLLYGTVGQYSCYMEQSDNFPVICNSRTMFLLYGTVMFLLFGTVG